MNSRHESSGSGRTGGGFTLIELIVVLSVIAILTSIGLLAAHHVRGNSQVAFTKDLIKTLDTAYSGIIQEKSANVPAIYRNDQGKEFAVIDAAIDSSAPTPVIIEPSQALFVLATGNDSAITTAIQRADSKYVVNSPIVSRQLLTANWTSPSPVPVLKDAWNKPIRFVHPRYAGGHGDYMVNGSPTTRLALGVTLAGNPMPVPFIRSYSPKTLSPTVDPLSYSADEGLCSGNVGYFYSAGVDGDAGSRDNNVYSTVPQFPLETSKLSPPPAGT